MRERRREWIKDTFYGDYTALLFTLYSSPGSRWVDVATRQWDGEMEDMTSHTSGGHTVSFPHESFHLSRASAPPDHSTPPHKELTNTDAKQGQTSLQWQVGSMGAWGGRWWERKWNHTTATNFWACSKTQRVLENGWEKRKEWEICDILIRDIKEGAGDLETPAFWSQRLF